MHTEPSLPILLAAGREESLRPLLIQLIVIIVAARAGAAVSALDVGRFEIAGMAGMIAATVVFAAAMLGIVRPLLLPRLERAVGADGKLPLGALSIVLAVAVVGKWGGCGLAAQLSGMPAGEAACVGVLMNTRALMELIVINVGLDLGVIPQSVYCMLVLMAISTTLMATPLVTQLLRGSPYAATLASRGFLRG